MSTSTVSETKTKIVLKPVKMWCVMLLNDDYTPFPFVIQVLTELFHKDQATAETITHKIHEKGRGVAGVYTQEIAQTKANDTMKIARANGHPLKAVAEEI